MLGHWICIYEVCEWNKCTCQKVLWRFTQKGMKYDFKKNVPFKRMFMHGCHTLCIHLLTPFFYTFKPCVSYGCLKDVFINVDLDMWFLISTLESMDVFKFSL